MNARPLRYSLETSDGRRYAVTIATLPDMIHRAEQHLFAGTIRSAVLVAHFEDGESRPLFHILPGFRRCRRLTHEQYCRWLAMPHRRAWRALRRGLGARAG